MQSVWQKLLQRASPLSLSPSYLFTFNLDCMSRLKVNRYDGLFFPPTYNQSVRMTDAYINTRLNPHGRQDTLGALQICYHLIHLQPLLIWDVREDDRGKEKKKVYAKREIEAETHGKGAKHRNRYDWSEKWQWVPARRGWAVGAG